MSTEESFCGVALLRISEYYAGNVIRYTNIPICFIGSIFNFFNVLVFTRKNMISPVNLIFTHLALVDLGMLLGAIPTSWIENVQHSGRIKEAWTYNEAVVYLCFNNYATTLHIVSVFLTVLLAVWRYIAIAHPLIERQWCNMKTTRKVILIGYIICLLVATPICLARCTVAIDSGYKVSYTQNPLLFSTSRMIRVLLTLLPSVMLAMFSLRLIVILIVRKTNKEKSTSSSTNIENNTIKRKTYQIDRSVIILFTVLTLFLVAEVPSGILFLMSMIYDVRSNEMHYRCYNSLILIFCSLFYINTSITFIVYFTMSQQFKNTFKSLFNRNTIYIREETTSTSANIRKCNKVSETGQCSEDIQDV